MTCSQRLQEVRERLSCALHGLYPPRFSLPIRSSTVLWQMMPRRVFLVLLRFGAPRAFLILEEVKKGMLSPCRVKSIPSVVLYDLRLIRPNTNPRAEKLARLFEGVVKKWRGVIRWYVQTHTSPRGEIVLQVVGERQSQSVRIDNLYASWRRSVANALQLSKDAVLQRASWTAVGADNYLLDVRVMHDTFDSASAKLWAEIGSAADATRCSYAEPAMPPLPVPPPPQQHRIASLPSTSSPTASAVSAVTPPMSTISSVLTPSSRDLQRLHTIQTMQTKAVLPLPPNLPTTLSSRTVVLTGM